MIPTIGEMIFYCVLGGGALLALIAMVGAKGDSMDITWGQRRDWERRERNGWM